MNPPQMVKRQIAGQGEEPGIEIALRIEMMNFFGHAHPGLLEQVLGLGGLADEPQKVAVEAILVPGNERRQGIHIATAELPCLGLCTHACLR